MDYQVVRLSDLDLSKLTLVKESTSRFNGQDHSRWVFRDDYRSKDGSRQTRYLKIWNPQHVRRDNVLTALEVGFYDDSTVPALTALIFHKGVCRGYVTKACELKQRFDHEYYKNLRKKTVECGFYTIQFSRYHLGHLNGSYSLIDLEGVHPIKDLPQMSYLRSFFDDEDYGQFVLSQFLALYPNRMKELGDYEFLPMRSWKSGLRKIADAVYPFRISRIWLYELRQWMKISIGPTHSHQIEL